MSERRYAAQQMRETADFYERNSNMVRQKVLSNAVLANIHESIAMLRQAADAEDELRTMRSTWMTPETSKELFDDCVSKTKENAQLKARLEAVVKECEKSLSRLSCTSCRSRCKMDNDIPECENPYLRCEVQNYNAILRVARGEGGSK